MMIKNNVSLKNVLKIIIPIILLILMTVVVSAASQKLTARPLPPISHHKNAYTATTSETAAATTESVINCSKDSDCPTCQICDIDSGTCFNEPDWYDEKHECGTCYVCTGTDPWTWEPIEFGCHPAYEGLNPYDTACLSTHYCQTPYSYDTAVCNGYGGCEAATGVVTPGDICINETAWDVPPTADHNAGIVISCVAGERTAQQYYLGYYGWTWNAQICYDGYVYPPPLSCFSIEASWTCFYGMHDAGTWTANPGYVINTTEIAETCSTKLASCASNAECGFCQKCVNSRCVNQGASQDLKNECNPSSVCQNPWTIFKTLDNCDGNGVCKTQTVNVGIGNVCYNGQNTNPSANANCGIWNNCVAGRTSANQYWVGYNNGSECIDTGWVATGGTWNVASHFMINTTEHAPVCQEVYRQCISNSECSLCQKCVNSQCVNQASGQDLKDECNSGSVCQNSYTIFKTLATCDGNGACKTNTVNVNVGKVCYNGQNTAPNADLHCGGLLYNCVEGKRTANQFYLGYTNDGTGTCTTTNWVKTGTIYTAPTGFVISPTQNAVSCTTRSR